MFVQILQSEMDRRSWPWKKKSSDKAAVEKVAAALSDQVNSLISVMLIFTDLEDFSIVFHFSCLPFVYWE